MFLRFELNIKPIKMRTAIPSIPRKIVVKEKGVSRSPDKSKTELSEVVSSTVDTCSALSGVGFGSCA